VQAVGNVDYVCKLELK